MNFEMSAPDAGAIEKVETVTEKANKLAIGETRLIFFSLIFDKLTAQQRINGQSLCNTVWQSNPFYCTRGR